MCYATCGLTSLVRGYYLEIQIYNSDGNRFYMQLMSISGLHVLREINTTEGHIDLKTTIRAQLLPSSLLRESL
jgi:hypothetical protein